MKKENCCIDNKLYYIETISGSIYIGKVKESCEEFITLSEARIIKNYTEIYLSDITISSEHMISFGHLDSNQCQHQIEIDIKRFKL